MAANSVIVCCGLDCGKCRAYLATRRIDRGTAAEIAKFWSNPEEDNYMPDDVWCDGCHSDRLQAFCSKCSVRICAKERRLENCGKCKEYPCEKFIPLWRSWVEVSPDEAKANLDRAHYN